nr:MAG TPA: hypothetical protein [Caudoviricetes sp.]
MKKYLSIFKLYSKSHSLRVAFYFAEKRGGRHY